MYKKSRHFYDTVLDLFLTQHICTPTHRSGTQPDLVLSSHPNLLNDVETLAPLGSSDHAMFLINLNLLASRKTAEKKGRNWRKADYNAMRDSLSKVHWDKEFENCNVHES